jgi:hypothetical protein
MVRVRRSAAERAALIDHGGLVALIAFFWVPLIARDPCGEARPEGIGRGRPVAPRHHHQ